MNNMTVVPAWILLGGALVACANNSPNAHRAPLPEEIPTFESVSGGRMTLGLELSPLREERTIEPFRMTKHPITVRRYKQCMSAGACDAPALASAECRVPGTEPQPHLTGPTLGVSGGEELPVTCVSPEQATAYCRWLGGKVPDSTQWLAAARGASVRRYAWGNTLSACEQHPEARLRAQSCDVNSPGRLRIGAHPAGASPTKIEDVLLTPAELVAASRNSSFSVCSEGVSGCLVRGMSPGAIDGFGPVATGRGAPDEAASSVLTYGFRCVIEGT